MDKNRSQKLYFEMLRIRLIEQTISEKYTENKMRCPVHLSIGQEAIPVGICSSLSKKDQIVSAHRSHAHYLAKGGELKSMLAEIYGKDAGCAKGRGGSMHLIDPSVGMIAAVPIVGSSLPIAVGLAWANKLDGNDKVVVVFFGDGAFEEGTFHESLNFSVLHRLSILFVCENNDFSVYTPLEDRQYNGRTILKIAAAHGVEGIRENGNDVLNVFEISKNAIDFIKEHKKPYFLELLTFRHLEHCGPSNDDHLGYRKSSYINEWIKKDPIAGLEQRLIADQIVFKGDIEKIKKDIQSEIITAFEFAEDSKFPELHDLIYNVYY